MRLTKQKMEEANKRFKDENKDGQLNESLLFYTSKLIDFKNRISKLSDKQFEQYLDIFREEYAKRKNK